MIRRANLKTNLVFVGWVAACVLADLGTKSWVRHHFGPVQLTSYDLIPGVLGIWYKENSGGVFGLGQGRSHVFVVLTVVALVALTWLFLTTDRTQTRLNIGIALITAGALGNLYDRVLNGGRVRDFIDVHIAEFYHWYTFNLADSCICIGVGLLVLDAFISTQEPSDAGEADNSASSRGSHPADPTA